MKRTCITLFCLFIILHFFSSCEKNCRPSTTDCTTIRYKCEPGEEVCGCDDKTYDCALDAECSGKIADYKKGKCK